MKRHPLSDRKPAAAVELGNAVEGDFLEAAELLLFLEHGPISSRGYVGDVDALVCSRQANFQFNL